MDKNKTKTGKNAKNLPKIKKKHWKTWEKFCEINKKIVKNHRKLGKISYWKLATKFTKNCKKCRKLFKYYEKIVKKKCVKIDLK